MSRCSVVNVNRAYCIRLGCCIFTHPATVQCAPLKVTALLDVFTLRSCDRKKKERKGQLLRSQRSKSDSSCWEGIFRFHGLLDKELIIVCQKDCLTSHL